MTARVLIAAQLTGEPLTRATKNGGEVTFFKLKVASGNRLDYWSCTTFNEAARKKLEGLGEGDAVSATGELEVSTYEAKTGETRVGLKMLASSRRILIEVDGASTRTRLISPREAARLMGLPDSYRLPANTTRRSISLATGSPRQSCATSAKTCCCRSSARASP